jgi:hypothetical protein
MALSLIVISLIMLLGGNGLGGAANQLNFH